MRTLVVGNPAASGFDAGVREAIERQLGRVAWLDPSPGDLRAAAARAELVVVAGGDGSLHHAVNDLADRLDEITFGLVPVGTGNDFARAAGIPEDPAAAARAVATGRPRTFDVGRAAGGGVERLFVNACMGGFPVQVNEAIDEDVKRKLGPLAFWVGGAKAATALTRSRISVGGVEMEDCVAAGVGNGRTCGGGIEVWPRADPSDGLLDACALGGSNAAALLRLLLSVRKGEHEGLDGVAVARGGRVDIDADPPIELNVDGELVGLRTPATFEVCGSFRLMVAPE